MSITEGLCPMKRQSTRIGSYCRPIVRFVCILFVSCRYKHAAKDHYGTLKKPIIGQRWWYTSFNVHTAPSHWSCIKMNEYIGTLRGTLRENANPLLVRTPTRGQCQAPGRSYSHKWSCGTTPPKMYVIIIVFWGKTAPSLIWFVM